MSSIASLLDGKLVHPDHLLKSSYDRITGVYTFRDSSQAKHIVEIVNCEPYIAPSTTTMSTRNVYRWKEVNASNDTTC